MNTKAKTVLLIVAFSLLIGGLAGQYGGTLISMIPISIPVLTEVEQAAVVYESGFDKPPTKEQTKIYALAPSVGCWVVDLNTPGPGRQPSEKLKPFIDVAAGKELPILVVKYVGGRMEVSPLPATFNELKVKVNK